MPTPRAFITYRDLYDRRPSAEELQELLKGLNAFNTVLLLTRLSTMFRHASVSVAKQDSTSNAAGKNNTLGLKNAEIKTPAWNANS
jgi:hypothetical protein